MKPDFPAGVSIIVDSREQLGYEFPGLPTERMGLATGDYGVRLIDGTVGSCAVERKALSDAIGTFTVGRDRWVRELERLNALDASAVIVEATLFDIEQMRDPATGRPLISRTTPQSIIGSMIAWMHRFPRIAWILAGNRSGGQRMTHAFLRRYAIDNTATKQKAAARGEKQGGQAPRGGVVEKATAFGRRP